jgi:hypothetical protein
MLILLFINVFYPRLSKINFTFCVSVVIILNTIRNYNESTSFYALPYFSCITIIQTQVYFKNGEGKFLQNICKILQDFTTSPHKRQ